MFTLLPSEGNFYLYKAIENMWNTYFEKKAVKAASNQITYIN